MRGLLCQDGSLHWDGALPHQADLHRPAGDQLLHGEPRLYDGGTQVSSIALYIPVISVRALERLYMDRKERLAV